MKHAGGRPTKMTTEYLDALRNVLGIDIDDSIDAIIYTDEELFELVNDKLPKENRICNTTWKQWKAKGMFKSVGIEPNKNRYKNNPKIKFKNQAQYQKEYYHRVIKKDANKRIRLSFSSLMNYHIKKNGESVCDIIKDYLDYDFNILMNHLEKQFTGSMNWDNYGLWHIDHIKPASLFNYTKFTDVEFRECWSLDNLQPLWAIDNLKKGDRYV